jgi:homeodomain-containing protein
MGTEAKAVVRLSIEERVFLERVLTEPRVSKDRVLRVNLLLKTDADGPNWPDSRIAEAFQVSTDTVARLRHRCVFEGLEAATARRPHRATRRPRLDGAAEARLVQLACSAPPAGAAKWTMQLLADRLVSLSIVEEISDETVRKTLKKTNCSRGAKRAT